MAVDVYILITDIGRGDTDSLICVTDDPGTYFSFDWYLHPTSSTTDFHARLVSTDPRGWLRNRDMNVKGFRIVRLKRDTTQTDSVEGVFTCRVAVDTGDPISVGIYYASETQRAALAHVHLLGVMLGYSMHIAV